MWVQRINFSIEKFMKRGITAQRFQYITYLGFTVLKIRTIWYLNNKLRKACIDAPKALHHNIVSGINRNNKAKEKKCFYEGSSGLPYCRN
jgi:hypothetical protein